MKKTMTALALVSALSVSGCYTPQQQTGTLAGGAIGAGGGALIGSAITGGSAGGAIAGGIIGAGTGALVGTAVGANKDIQEAKQAKAQAQAYANAHPPLSLSDIVALANNGTSDAIIIQQMASTNSYYNLTAADIQYLQGANVHQAVILAMQQRTVPGPVVVQPRPVVVYDPYPPPPPAVIGVGIAPGYYRRW